MKKKIIIGLILLVPFISILLVIIFRLLATPTNEDIVKNLKEIKCYESKVQYIIKNSITEYKEETSQYYSKEKGVRVDFGEEKTKIYKGDGIHVSDNISNSRFVIDSSMDILHSLAFMNKILSYPVIEGSFKEGQEEWGDTIYLQMDVELFLDNLNLNTARIFIDKKTEEPIGTIVFDKNGEPTVRIIYTDFKKVKQIDDTLL